MVDALRMPRGPRRVPERTCVPRSYGAPMMATSASSVARSGAYGTFANVAMPVKGRFMRSVTRESLRAACAEIRTLGADSLGHQADDTPTRNDSANSLPRPHRSLTDGDIAAYNPAVRSGCRIENDTKREMEMKRSMIAIAGAVAMTAMAAPVASAKAPANEETARGCATGHVPASVNGQSSRALR